jgi:hypothetical protein
MNSSAKEELVMSKTNDEITLVKEDQENSDNIFVNESLGKEHQIIENNKGFKTDSIEGNENSDSSYYLHYLLKLRGSELNLLQQSPCPMLIKRNARKTFQLVHHWVKPVYLRVM